MHIRIKLPGDLSAEDPSVREARHAALVSAVIKLWQGGHLSTRVAARRLGLEYYDYIDLLAAREVPVLSEPADPQEVDRLVEEIKTARGR